MTEISHARARNASIAGLLVQAAACAGVAALAMICRTIAGVGLAWFIGGGLIPWLVALLVTRQRELATLEQRDLEILRREKQAVGGEGMFDESGFRIAEMRLAWMLRWLVPTFSLISSAYLFTAGVLTWLMASSLPIGAKEWVPATQLSLALIVLPVVIFITFLYSRYASGMGRVPEWSILRACGSYLLGNTLAAFALTVCLGVAQYAARPAWEHALAYIMPLVMLLLGTETVLNFILDIYRPRTPGVEPRAALDSRLLGLFSEPGGLAHSIAEAMNYQFGFQVSQTWFYKLLARTFFPLVGVGALALWLLSTVVIVNTGERAIIERFGQQVDPDHPLTEGVHVKLPWPMAVSHKLNTEELRQITIGFKIDVESSEENPHEQTGVVLWTDAQHGNRPHFDFVMASSKRAAGDSSASQPTPRATVAKDVPVHILRMSMVVQYRINAAKLSAYISRMSNPETLLRNIAWQELVRFDAATDVDSLLGDLRGRVGEMLAERIRARLDALDLGIQIVHVGLQAVHPENTVAQAFQRVVVAEQEKVTAVRQAQVKENSELSKVAGGRAKALALAEAIEFRDRYDAQISRAEQALRESGKSTPPELSQRLDGLAGNFALRVERDADARRAKQALDSAEQDFKLGLGPTMDDVAAARRALEQAQAADKAGADSLNEALKPWRSEAGRLLDAKAAAALVDLAQARAGVKYWSGQLELQFRGLEGEAARMLAEAQSERWRLENQAAAEFARLENERQAYAVAPDLYKQRRYLDVLYKGMRATRKYFLAFDAHDRNTKVRIEAQESARTDITDLPSRME